GGSCERGVHGGPASDDGDHVDLDDEIPDRHVGGRLVVGGAVPIDIYALSLRDGLPIYREGAGGDGEVVVVAGGQAALRDRVAADVRDIRRHQVAGEAVAGALLRGRDGDGQLGIGRPVHVRLVVGLDGDRLRRDGEGAGG